jgi:hypothetical protein
LATGFLVTGFFGTGFLLTDFLAATLADDFLTAVLATVLPLAGFAFIICLLAN